MSWSVASTCEKFAILCDIAALANIGGGHLIIGRNAPTFARGSLDPKQAQSFDPVLLNAEVLKYLSPAIACAVDVAQVDGDTLVVINVPGFKIAPLIFSQHGKCGDSRCGEPHFLPGDIFIRSQSMESRKIRSAEEMHQVLRRAVGNTSDELLNAIRIVLEAR